MCVYAYMCMHTCEKQPGSELYEMVPFAHVFVRMSLVSVRSSKEAIATQIMSHIHTYEHTYMYTYTHKYMDAIMQIEEHWCTCTCVYVCVNIELYIYIYIYAGWRVNGKMGVP